MKLKLVSAYLSALILLGALSKQSIAQTNVISGKVTSEGSPIEYAHVALVGTSLRTSSDSTGKFKIKGVSPGTYKIQVTYIGFSKVEKWVTIKQGINATLHFDLTSLKNNLNEVVVSGTLKEVNRAESTVPVEVYAPSFFKKNPTPNIFDALQNVNGVRPQLNCSVCNTGDIHINGLEGAYTMILIDGMPIVSGLATTYGLSGIPNSLVERIEIVKGPASSLYGSEAVAGIVNIITKKPQNAPWFSADVFSTTHQEWNTDLGFKTNVGTKATALTGINYFKYGSAIDHNGDGFTDVTLQDRISVFQKWNFERKNNRLFNLAGRFNYEDRWGGDMRWTKAFRGGDELYGESIYTARYELLGAYQLPTKENVMASFSYNYHDQDSRYGTDSYIARQQIGFAQLRWDGKWGHHDLLAGTSLRYTQYSDNTPATNTVATQSGSNAAIQLQKSWLPGVFVQDEIAFMPKHKLLLGFRYDYNSVHGSIYTPRLGYKWTINDKNSIRFNAGTGYRIVNLFSEDHAALTGSRTVVIKNELKPEQSYNANLNYMKKIHTLNGTFIGFDASAFYTYFENKITPDYDTDQTKIIYDNTSGHAVSRGVSTNVDIAFNNGFKVILGGTYLDTYLVDEKGEKQWPIRTERFAGTWALSYKFKKMHLGIDYTGNLYSPMRLKLINELDPRREYSPWWSIQNIQLVYSGFKHVEVYGGVKNLLNWTPNQGNPFIIARTEDPFNKNLEVNNPYNLRFDADYNYAPNQGIRGFLGVRMAIR